MRPGIEKLMGIGVAAAGLFVPALILPLRSHFCRQFEVGNCDFYPLSGDVNGYDPQLFTRVMHNLTNPLFVCTYALVMVFLALKTIVGTSPATSRQRLLAGQLCAHIAYLGLYSYSISLPVGDLVIHS